ncbi:MAG: holin [Xanthomonadaceae bacterium]|nr:holin [Xanthomonadaceae bacterium]
MKHGAHRMDQHDRGLLMLFAVGALVAVGKAMASAESVPWRVFAGRAIVGGTTAMIAAVVLALWPDLPAPALYGLASLAGHIGAEGLMKFAGDYLNRKRES